MYEINYKHDRRAHRHRCQCCLKIVNAGERVLMYRAGKHSTRVVHAACADRPTFDGLTYRELGQLHDLDVPAATRDQLARQFKQRSAERRTPNVS